MREKHLIGDIVYLITDEDQKERMVTAILKEHNTIDYQLSCGASKSWHKDIEIATVKDYRKV